MDMDALKDQIAGFKGKKTKSIITDKYLNQFEEVLEDGVYKKKLIGNKKKQLSTAEAAYYLDTKLCKIIDKVYIGSGDCAKVKEPLIEAGITHVLNLATGVPNMFPEHFSYMHKAISDLPDSLLSTILDDCLKFMKEACTNGAVFVHCNQGISRSASVIIAYLMKEHSLTYSHALQLCHESRPSIRPNYGFEKQLMEFGEQLRGHEMAAVIPSVAAAETLSDVSDASAGKSDKSEK